MCRYGNYLNLTNSFLALSTIKRSPARLANFLELYRSGSGEPYRTTNYVWFIYAT